MEDLSAVSGGVVDTVPMLSSTFQAVDHTLVPSTLSSNVEVSSREPSMASKSPLFSSSILECLSIFSSFGGSRSLPGRRALNSSLHSSFLASLESLFSCRISWKLFKAASDTSALWHRAEDSMNSRSSAQARGKSPVVTYI